MNTFPTTFDEVSALIRHRTLVDPFRLLRLWETAQSCAPLGGAIVEVGVYQGGSALLLRCAVPEADLVLYDTFTGHPRPSDYDDPGHPQGRFSDTSLEAVAALFDGHPAPPVLVAGRFPDSLSVRALPPRICFAHVDVDLYQGTRDAFASIWPLLVPDGAIICDDYGFPDCPGARRAVGEFVDRTPGAVLEELTSLQARVRKAAA